MALLPTPTDRIRLNFATSLEFFLDFFAFLFALSFKSQVGEEAIQSRGFSYACVSPGNFPFGPCLGEAVFESMKLYLSTRTWLRLSHLQPRLLPHGKRNDGRVVWGVVGHLRALSLLRLLSACVPFVSIFFSYLSTTYCPLGYQPSMLSSLPGRNGKMTIRSGTGQPMSWTCPTYRKCLVSFCAYHVCACKAT